jgi:hypothetical protein
MTVQCLDLVQSALCSQDRPQQSFCSQLSVLLVTGVTELLQGVITLATVINM